MTKQIINIRCFRFETGQRVKRETYELSCVHLIRFFGREKRNGKVVQWQTLFLQIKSRNGTEKQCSLYIQIR